MKAAKQLKRAAVRVHTYFEHPAPAKCPVCGCGPSFHGRYDYPIRRNGWCNYQCGRRWHPEHGWDVVASRCESIRMRAALVEILDEVGIVGARKVAREALHFQGLLRYGEKPKRRKKKK
jgi:hypothetical protein